ncbi:MFS transporter [Phytomonospora endophytica]|uniref:MFS family permease n=1 Tax=Phytomonospora endophytica TaxID=714109 RepID=A0A841FL14_9ACTN|nr:MFS transporter [Phytomonospora endophytica]MBB6032640.1 MFS family permease [Phytomonospora endophytica]GIG66210.1 MFS transporter [Phytomonospora endophytica]
MLLQTTPAKPAHRDGNVLRWLGAYTASVTGDVVYFLVLSWAVARIAGPAEVGLVLAAGAVPRAVLMLAGGVVADRLGPRRVVILSDLVRCLTIFAAAGISLGGGGPWPLVAVAVIFGAVDALFMPAVGALPPLLTGTGQLTRVQALRSLSIRFGNAAGPLLAALVLTAAGAPAGFVLSGVLFALSLVLLWSMSVLRRPEPPRESATTDPRGSAWRDLRDGLRHLRRERGLLPLVVVIGLGEMCFSGPVGAGFVLLADERGWTAGVLGATLSAFSVGGAVSGLALVTVNRVHRPALVMALSLSAAGILVAATGLASSAGLAIGFSGALGLVSGVAMVVGAGELQTRTDPRYLGRVTAVTTLCTLGLSPVLLPVAGLVSARFGTGVFFLGCAVICLLAAGIAVATRERG